MIRPDQREHIGGELHYWRLLSADEQAAAIRRLAASGMSDYGIAAATRLSVEMVRRLLSQKPL